MTAAAKYLSSPAKKKSRKSSSSFFADDGVDVSDTAESTKSPTSPTSPPVSSPNPPDSPTNGPQPAGATFKTQSNPATEPDASLFNLRVGPDYRRTGKKAPSAPALYKFVAADLTLVDDNVKSPTDLYSPSWGPGVVGAPWVPSSFIVNANLPTVEPRMLRPPESGPSFNVVFHFTIGDAASEELKKPEAEWSPSVRLMSEWFKRAPGDREFMGRFKAMCVIDDIEGLGLPGFINRFNGKPTLINRSGDTIRYKKGDGGKAVEVGEGEGVDLVVQHINVWIFSYVARKGLFYLQDKFAGMRLNVGFTIEGRSDEELPEVILGCCTLDGMDSNKVAAKGQVAEKAKKELEEAKKAKGA